MALSSRDSSRSSRNFNLVFGSRGGRLLLINQRTISKVFCSSHRQIQVELFDDDDFIVLACDGIWGCMSSQQLVDFIHEQLRTESKLSAVCERVLDKCLAPSTAGGEGCDNMTMILVQFKKPIRQSELLFHK